MGRALGKDGMFTVGFIILVLRGLDINKESS